MPVTLNYDLKRSMAILTKGDRWNVLTVLMLHTNVRNRCYPSMDTIAEMATGNNRNRATKAKAWLLKHGAIKLVEYNKRIDDEAKIPNRQHVYQLTGTWYACFDKDCDCGSNGAQYMYLYQGSQGQSVEDTERLEDEFHRTTIHTMGDSHRTPIETMEQGHRMNGHNMNGSTLSISSISSKKAEAEESRTSETKTAAAAETSTSDAVVQTDQDRVLDAFQNNINITIAPMILEDILDYLKDGCPADWFIDAIKEAVDHNARNWKYIKSILDRWLREGHTSKPKIAHKQSNILFVAETDFKYPDAKDIVPGLKPPRPSVVPNADEQAAS